MIKILDAKHEASAILILVCVSYADPSDLQFRIHTDLLAFTNDARRFILVFRYIIEKAPLQVYNSALIFSPGASII